MELIVAIVLCLGVAAAMPLTYLNEGDPLPHQDCHSVWKAGHRTNGTYRLTLNGTHHDAPCAFHGDFAFTIFLNRIDGVVSWRQPYHVYQQGFGMPLHDYFSGLDNLHTLTRDGKSGLDIRFMDWDGIEKYYVYNYFYVGDQVQGYQLKIGGNQYGNVQADMNYNNGQKFYTYDHADPHRCAITLHGGWWYNYEHSTNFCTRANPTGLYYNRHNCCPTAASNGIIWGSYKAIGPYHGGHYSLQRFVMSIRHNLR